MRLIDSLSTVIAIVGPTAVGKTEVALQLAERLNGEIVSADSRLFYRGMDIGTAKPTQEELRRVPHHLIDVADPDDSWSLALFQSAAIQAIDQIHSRGRLPFLVGGTGQYVWSVIENWEIPAQEPDHRLRAALERWAEDIGPIALFERLRSVDPEAAAHIEPRNLRRTVRALEVMFNTGRRFSEQRLRGESPYRWKIVGLIRPRDELYRRVDARIEAMIAQGFVDEVRSLLERGYSPDLPTMSAIGYSEIVRYLQGTMTMDEAIMHMKRLTRAFVRRQANWFKQEDPRIQWFRCWEGTVDEIEGYLAKETFDPGHLDRL
jgi:tRNA dimethylallyltransferase